jgi:hypothetical protein
MTKAKISEYDAVASNNTDVNGVNIAENCPPSGMNNMGREIMAALKRFQVGSDGDGVTVGGNLVVSGSSTLSTTSISSADINAGTIDGTAIGGSTPAAGSFTTLNTSGAVVFNDAGANVDFRVEGDTDANLLFVDASTDRVGVKNGTPESTFTIANNASTVDVQFLRIYRGGNSGQYAQFSSLGGAAVVNSQNGAGGTIIFSGDGGVEKARLDGSGNLLVGTTSTSISVPGQIFINESTHKYLALVHASSISGHSLLYCNRQNSDGTLIEFRQANTTEGSITVSGTTVSYLGGHLSRWAQTLSAKDDLLKKGTVLSNLDEMNVYVKPTLYWTEEDELPVDEEGNPTVAVGDVKEETSVSDNEQLNKVKVSDVEGDPNVAGVFVNWEYDEAHQVDEINMAMTGDMIIRIAQGVTVARGDLLMSAGDGTAKPQGDDIVRSKTIAKVTSTHVTCTYDDGSYCVPCVLMAC